MNFSFLKQKKYRFFIGAVLLALAVVIIYHFVTEFNLFFKLYGDYRKFNESLENWIISIQNKPLVFVLILLLFVLKTQIFILPFNALYLISGIVFSLPAAFAVNVIGTFLQLTAAFRRGRRSQSRFTKFIARKFKINRILERDGGNLMLLFGLRIVPLFPINTVSMLYGGVKCSYYQFCIVSIVGLTPKIAGYTLIGKAVFDPLSPNFLIPFGMLVIVSAVGAYLFSRFTKKRNAIEIAGENALKK